MKAPRGASPAIARAAKPSMFQLLAAEATVNLVEEKRQNLGRWTWKPGWVISYRYRDHTGQSHTGASGYLSRKEAQRWRNRDKCAIIYDPAQPWQSVWVGGHDA